jgi:hypothetical protein
MFAREFLRTSVELFVLIIYNFVRAGKGILWMLLLYEMYIETSLTL